MIENNLALAVETSNKSAGILFKTNELFRI